MGISYSGFPDLSNLKRALQERVARELELATSDEVTRMIQRTQQGKDVDGKPFASYSPEYAAFKAGRGRVKRSRKKGRRRQRSDGEASFWNGAAGSSAPDLTFTGKMLGAITYKVSAGLRSGVATATVYFKSAKEAAKALGNQQKRRFFGFSQEQRQRIRERLERLIGG